MVKYIYSAILFLLLSVCLSAQNIAGKWTQTNSQSEDNMTIALNETLTLSENSQMSESALITMDIKDKETSKTIVIKIKISCGGKWQYSDGILTQTLDTSSMKTEILEKPDEFPDMLVNMFKKTMTSEFKKAAKKPVRNKVISLTSDTLKVQKMDEKDAEVETFKR